MQKPKYKSQVIFEMRQCIYTLCRQILYLLCTWSYTTALRTTTRKTKFNFNASQCSSINNSICIHKATTYINNSGSQNLLLEPHKRVNNISVGSSLSRWKTCLYYSRGNFSLLCLSLIRNLSQLCFQEEINLRCSDRIGSI